MFEGRDLGHFQGLSPHTRGNPPIGRFLRSSIRSIPAHTGKPGIQVCGAVSLQVYPRTHGETRACLCGVDNAEGLSPHTRGNHLPPVAAAGLGGSIPAHTGKANCLRAVRSVMIAVVFPRTQRGKSPPCSFLEVMRVYPRTHGETTVSTSSAGIVKGLSPHTRGNLRDFMPFDRGPYRLGSIPAHTGKPAVTLQLLYSRNYRVYPRTHGETCGSYAPSPSCQGLSPHTRGNLRLFHHPVSYLGSIPAHTGKPERRNLASGRMLTTSGLSPHTRGNRNCAATELLNPLDRVYPRTHGETAIVC